MAYKSEDDAVPKLKDYGTVIGIDLGTTYSCVAVYQHGRVEVITNDQGYRVTPSCVAFTSDGERIIGEAAVNQLTTNPENTVFDVKRLIGRQWNDEAVQKNIPNYPFRVVEKKSVPHIEFLLGNEKLLFAPEEISAMVLTRMKETAEKYLGKKVTHAVITVPAYFNDGQRQSTKDAGRIAGLTVLRILNEPTAAAIAYGVDKELEKKTLLVFDLGGGTFDVTVLSINHGDFKVLATSGDTNLGGEDFDLRVVDHFVKIFEEKYKKNIKGNKRAIQRLRKEVEKAKRCLSTQLQVGVYVDCLVESYDFSEILSRATLEHLNKDLLKATMETVKMVLDETGITKSDIDEVVLVGGSTRIPKVHDMVKDFFVDKDVSRGINADEAVAYGAAVYAAVLSGEIDTGDTYQTLIDVNPLSLGISIIGDIMSNVIKRNTTIPARNTNAYTTTSDNQTTVGIRVYEGERPIIDSNHKLGHFTLKNIPPAPRGVPKIDVTFEIDFDGILVVSAVSRGLDNKERVIIRNESRLSAGEIAEMIESARKYAELDAKRRELIEYQNNLEHYVYNITTQMNKADASGEMSAVDKETVQNTLSEHKFWLDQHRKAPIKSFEAEKRRLERIVQSIASLHI